jgi:hypothetical protein
MKESLRKHTSRRGFLKAAAVASTIVAAPLMSKAAQRKSNRSANDRENATSKKLGALKDQPSGSAFKKLPKRRMPDWRPDTAKRFLHADDDYYFEEELVGKIKKKGRDGKEKYVFHRFPPPNLFPERPNDTREAFLEPNDENDHQAWRTFNQWMLGGSLDRDSKVPFDVLLNAIANRVRRYNAALYWLRRLHFVENAPDDSTVPPSNPNGDDDEKGGYTPAPGNATFTSKVEKAERDWIAAVDALNDMLSGKKLPDGAKNLKYIQADMVEVNGYLVSMRVIAQEDDFVSVKGKVKTKEVAGSSSSHTSISSAFFSPPPPP